MATTPTRDVMPLMVRLSAQQSAGPWHARVPELTDRSYLCRSWQQPSRLHGSCRASLTCPQTKAVVSMCKTAHTAIPATIGQGGDEFPPRQARWCYLHQSGYSMGRCLSAGGAFEASGTKRMPAASFSRRRCPETRTAAASGLAALAPAEWHRSIVRPVTGGLRPWVRQSVLSCVTRDKAAAIPFIYKSR